MTRILVVGDIHVSDAPPANCTESYTDDIIEMLMWVADYAVNAEVDAVVWAGDIFHFKAPSKNSHALVLKMIRVVEKHQGRLWIVPGNHDISNDRLESIHEKQPLGVLYAAGAHELSGWHETLPLYGVPWQQTWTSDPQRALTAFDDYSEAQNHAAWPKGSLVVTHAPIYPPALVEKGVPFDLVDTKDLAAAMGGRGFLYYGHIHEDHGVFEDGGVTFANLGAISRGSLVEYNVEREIKVALWTPEDGFTEVPVPHKPASEVFRMVEAAGAKEAKINLEDFLSRVGSAQLDISSTASVVSHLRTMTDVPEPVRTRAEQFLEAVDG